MSNATNIIICTVLKRSLSTPLPFRLDIALVMDTSTTQITSFTLTIHQYIHCQVALAY